MTQVQKSSLPAVLKEYLSDYEPRLSTKKTPRETKPEPGQQVPATLETGPGEDTDGKEKDETRLNEAKTQRKSAPRLPSRERSILLQRKQEREKNEQNFQNWQRVKDDSRDEKHKHFTDKIVLQQQLIRRQDELFEKQRRLENHQTARKREEEKLSKRLREEELLQICKESLDEDRRKIAERHAARQKREKESQYERSKDDVFTGTSDQHFTRWDLSSQPQHNIHSNTAAQNTTTLPKSILREATEYFTEDKEPTGRRYEDEDEDEDEDEEMPWHHDQLYQLLGADADYFLHPKLEENTPRPTRSLPSPEQLQTGGAGELWTTLRKDSRRKLLQEDSYIPGDLKAAYGAFVRQLLTKRQKPIKRNYYAKEDVPDMEQLLDHSKTQNVREFRHKVELMLRSSQINEDRSRVLLFNNPLPRINDLEGQESCSRYMPSWIEQNSDTASEASYKKWLGGSNDELLGMPLGKQDAVVPPGDGLKNTKYQKLPPDGSNINMNEGEWAFLQRKGPSKTSNKSAIPKLQFLTEEAAKCEPEFSKRRKELKEAKNQPKGFSEFPHRPAVKAQSALGLVTDRESNSSPENKPTRRSCSITSQHQFSRGWEPLSLMALAEYKGSMNTLGSGNFGQGSTVMWSVG